MYNINKEVRQVVQHFIDDSHYFWKMYERLEQAYREHEKLIIAYDLDDTVRPFRSEKCDDTIAVIKRCKEILDAYFIVYTANADYNKNWRTIEEFNLPCDSLNSYPHDEVFDSFRKYQMAAIPTKLYYNIFLDDKTFGLRLACKALTILCNKVESEKRGGKE